MLHNFFWLFAWTCLSRESFEILLVVRFIVIDLSLGLNIDKLAFLGIVQLEFFDVFVVSELRHANVIRSVSLFLRGIGFDLNNFWCFILDIKLYFWSPILKNLFILISNRIIHQRISTFNKISLITFLLFITSRFFFSF